MKFFHVYIIEGQILGRHFIIYRQIGQALICRYLNFMEGENIMLKFMLVATLIVVIMGIVEISLPRLKLKYRLYKEQKEMKRRQQIFRNKMKELEIK